MLMRSFMPIIFCAVLSVLVPFLTLLGSLLVMSGRLVRPFLPESVSFSALLNLRLWDVSGGGGFWNVRLGVGNLGGHLEFTLRARAGTLSKRIREATLGVAAVGALPLGFQVKLGLVRGKCLLAGLHAAEASHVSSSSISALRAASVRAVWSAKMPLLVFLMVLLELILLVMLFGPGSV